MSESPKPEKVESIGCSCLGVVCALGIAALVVYKEVVKLFSNPDNLNLGICIGASAIFSSRVAYTFGSLRPK